MASAASSAKLWRQQGMTLERVKAERQKEAEAAAKYLGVADIQFWNLGDYPIALNEDALYRLVDVYRAIHPAFVLTHSQKDIYNHDHPAVTEFAQHARIVAQAHGHNPGQKVLGAPPVFLFEPHQPEQCDWKPTVLSGHHAGLGQEARCHRVHGRARSTCGNTTPASPCSAARRRPATPTRKSPTAKATRASFRMCVESLA